MIARATGIAGSSGHDAENLEPSDGAASVDGRLAPWLLRAYIDLGRCARGPLYARGIDEYWRAFADPSLPQFALQRTLLPGFRAQLVEAIGRPEYGVSDPRDLAQPLRTTRWQSMCEALDDWRELGVERQFRLVLLLHSLCLYDPVLSLVPGEGTRRLNVDNAGSIDLLYWRASAKYVVGIPRRIADYHAADLSMFNSIAEQAREAVPAAFNSAVKVFVHKAKTGAPVAELEPLGDRMERIHADTVNRVDAFLGGLLSSRFYRALGFLPQRRGDRAEVVRIMDLAERFARGMKPRTRAQKLLYLENLHPVMESRAKEALWLGDHELALARALEVTQLDPYDSKGWVELGQVRRLRKEWALAAEAYLLAGMLGPPAAAIGRHMAGLCFRDLGQHALAAFLFKETLEVDPLGISPRDEIRKLPDLPVLRALKEWSRTTVRL